MQVDCQYRTKTFLFAELCIPSPASIVVNADCILSGAVSANESQAFIDVASTMKGQDLSAQKLPLMDPTATLGFDPVGVVKAMEDTSAIFLGRYEPAAGNLALNWLHASLWPPKPEFDTFPSSQLDQCRDFVEAILGYENLAARDLMGVVEQLVHDAEGDRLYAALDWTDTSVATYFKQGQAELGSQLGWALYAKTLGRKADQHLENQLVNMFPLLPPSQAIPRLLNIAERPQASLATGSTVEAFLRAHGCVTPGKQPPEQLRTAFNMNRIAFLRQDEEKCRRMLSSPSKAIKSAATILLDSIATELR